MKIDLNADLGEEYCLKLCGKLRLQGIHFFTGDINRDDPDDGFTAHIAFKSGLTAHIEVGTTNFIKLPRWYVKGTEGSALIADWDLSGGVVTRVRESVTPEPVPIQAGVGLTKTMAPPNEDAVAEHPLPAPLHPQTSFYNNVAQAATLEPAMPTRARS